MLYVLTFLLGGCLDSLVAQALKNQCNQRTTTLGLDHSTLPSIPESSYPKDRRTKQGHDSTYPAKKCRYKTVPIFIHFLRYKCTGQNNRARTRPRARPGDPTARGRTRRGAGTPSTATPRTEPLTERSAEVCWKNQWVGPPSHTYHF